MARYQVILSYDGTEFHGFQRQGNERTVQLEVEHALRKLGWEGRSILASGRTDSGVHASGQVITFDLDWAHSVETLQKALSAHLPADIGVRGACITGDDFHPRFDATQRSYRYQIYFQPFRDPLRDRFAWRLWPKPQPGLPNEAAALFLGQHDFQSFGSPMKPGGNTVRVVTASHWSETPEGWTYEISANAFLYHMVRRSVFMQIQTAMQKFDLNDLRRCVEEAAPSLPGMAPANGLNLYSVEYGDAAREEWKSWKKQQISNETSTDEIDVWRK